MQFRVLIRSLLVILFSCSVLAQPVVKVDAKNIHAKGNNEFAFSLYHHIKKANGNIFYSPYSLRAALAMTYAGAKNETAAEMASALKFALEGRELHSTFAATSEDLEADDDSGYELSIANSLWGQRDYMWREEFLTVTAKYYGAGLTEADFMTIEHAEEARNEINSWVEQCTNSKIMNLIPKNKLNPKSIPGYPPRKEYVRLVLANAIYFKGDWQFQFPENATVDELFFVGEDERLVTPLMHRLGGGYRYTETDGIQILELPYKGDRLSMVVLLPKEKYGLERLEGKLSAESFEEWTSELRKFDKVDVFLPNFEITWSGEMSDLLKSTGMKTAFTTAADFSGMVDYQQQPDPLFIGAVFHKAFVDVNEEGTEAAAATAVVMKSMSTESIELTRPIPVFRADHPFVFLILDKVNGNILFLGRMVKPK